jgi:hypothetical protein
MCFLWFLSAPFDKQKTQPGYLLASLHSADKMFNLRFAGLPSAARLKINEAK